MSITVDSVGVALRPGERLRSFDVTPSGRWVLAADDGRRSFVRFNGGAEVTLRGNHGHLIIAACGPGAAVVVAPRTSPMEANAWIVTQDGVERGFYAGDAVTDLAALPNGLIVLSYFDEGFAKPVSDEGVAAFGRDGVLRRGYRTTTGNSIMDCFATVAVGSTSVAFWPYPDWRLTIWDTEEGTERTHVVPGTVRGASAITHSGDRWWFFSPYGRPRSIFEWRVGSPKVTKVGVTRGLLRGIPGGRFLDEGENGPAVVSIGNR